MENSCWARASPIWTYALNYAFVSSVCGSELLVYGKQFKSRELAIHLMMTELKRMMTEKSITPLLQTINSRLLPEPSEIF